MSESKVSPLESAPPGSATSSRRCIIVTQMREHGFSGPQVHAAVAARFLAAHGWQVTLLTPFSGRAFLRKAVFGVRFLLKPFSGALDVFWYRFGHGLYLSAALKKELNHSVEPVVIYAQDSQSAKAALALRRPGKDKVVMIVHFNDSQADEWVTRGSIKPESWIYRRIAALEVELLPRVDTLVYVSRYMQAKLEERIPALQNVPHTVIPNFVEQPVPDPAVEARDLIAVGTLEPRKNQAYILHVIAALKARGMHVSASLVGGGQDLVMLQQLAQRLGIKEQVFFAGNVAGAAHWIPRHRLQVHAAFIENCPISLIEALAAGVPIVAAAVGGIPEIVDPATGDFWDLASAEDGADKISALLSNGVRLSQLQNNCRDKYQAVFAPHVAAQRLMDVFTQVLR